MMKTANGNTRTNHLDQPTFPFVNTSLHSLLTRNIRPKTNNAIEGLFTALKSRLRAHNGMSQAHKERFVDGFFRHRDIAQFTSKKEEGQQYPSPVSVNCSDSIDRIPHRLHPCRAGYVSGQRTKVSVFFFYFAHHFDLYFSTKMAIRLFYPPF